MNKDKQRIKELEAQISVLSLNPNQSGWLLVQSMQSADFPLDPVNRGKTAEDFPKWPAAKVAKVPNWKDL